MIIDKLLLTGGVLLIFVFVYGIFEIEKVPKLNIRYHLLMLVLSTEFVLLIVKIWS